MTTRYHRVGSLAYVTIDGVDRGAVLIERPGWCASCGERSQWPLCAQCHDAVLDWERGEVQPFRPYRPKEA
jgi:hypothetical protein